MMNTKDLTSGHTKTSMININETLSKGMQAVEQRDWNQAISFF